MAKKKLIPIAIAVIIVVALFLPGFSRLQKLKEENRNLERRITVLERTNEDLLIEKKKLETDLSYVEKVAREKLGMAKKGEIILK
ncbi:MAG: septum formation initiator family protein [Candidatus Omnitrophota bacterium]